MQQIRVYYECLEQAAHFILPLLNVPQNYEVLLIRREKSYSLYSQRVAPIIYWKDPDILICAVQNGVEFPLLQIEFSTAEYAADHELQRFDGLVASAKSNCIYAKISPSTSKSKTKSHGGDTKFNHLISYATIYQKYGVICYHFNWKIKDERLVVNPNYLSCPADIDELKILITNLIEYVTENKIDNNWLLHFQDLLCSSHVWFAGWRSKLENTQIINRSKLNSSRTKWNEDEQILNLKINRFGHAMDPERGMLSYYGSVGTTKCIMKFSSISSTWYNTVSRELAIREYIKQNGLNTAFDYLYLLIQAAGLYRHNEFQEILEISRNKNDELITIDITEFARSKFFQLNKPLKTILYYSNNWTIVNDEGVAKVILYWEKLQTDFDFNEYLMVTPIEIKTSFEEDEITYISVHNVLRPNGYKLVAVSYPGAQGDRAVLPEKHGGRTQPRIFIDIVAYLPDEHTNLQENKPLFRINAIQSDIDKLNLFKSDAVHESALNDFLQKYDDESPRKIKIGVGFWANKLFTVRHIQDLDINDLDYFMYISPDRTSWTIFSTGNEKLFKFNRGQVSLPIRYKIQNLPKSNQLGLLDEY